MAGGWTNGATKALLGIWGDSTVQNQLDGVVRNKTIYQKIARQLKEKGFDHTWEQCRTKIKNLVKAYRKVKDNNNVSGRGRKSTAFYDELDAILGTRAASRPRLLLDSSGVDAVCCQEDIAAVLETETANEAPALSDEENDHLVPVDSRSGSSSDTNSTTNSNSATPAPSTTSDSPAPNSTSSSDDGGENPVRDTTSNSSGNSSGNSSPKTKRSIVDNRKRGTKRKESELTNAEMLERIFEKAEERVAEKELKLRKVELEFEERMREREDQRDLNMLNMFGTLLQKLAETKQLS